MKNLLKPFLFVSIFITAFAVQTSAQASEWHKITDPATLESMNKITPYLGHAGTTTTKDTKSASLSMFSNKDSSLTISLTIKNGGKNSQTDIILKKAKGNWYSEKPYASEKEYIDGLVQKIVNLL